MYVDHNCGSVKTFNRCSTKNRAGTTTTANDDATDGRIIEKLAPSILSCCSSAELDVLRSLPSISAESKKQQEDTAGK